MVPNVEVSRIVTLSTAHITPMLDKYLSASARRELPINDFSLADSFGFVVYEKDDYGYFVYLPPDGGIDFLAYTPEGEAEEVSVLQKITKFASEMGCSIICFDRDAEETDALPVYEW